MTKGLLGALLIAATALTPIAASAQDDGFGSRIMREARSGNGTYDIDRAPRPQRQERQQQRQERQEQRQEQRQQQRNDAPRVRVQAPEQQAEPAPQQQVAPASQQVQRPDGGWRGENRGDWQGRANARNARNANADADAAIQRRGEVNREFGDRAVREARREAARRDGAFDNRQGRYDGRQWDHNRDGAVDHHWDRNDNGRVDRRWDRNRDGNLDRRWDRNDDERIDRRYDRDRDGRWDRHDRYDNRTGQRWNHSWRNDRRYDWRSHRSRYSDRYRLGRYYSPYRNWNYRRLTIGFSLWPLFYSDRYWINDPWNYRLPDVYGPYRWVRYYDDALLVDLRTGEVVDVIGAFFW
jgi:hypothetical protein